MPLGETPLEDAEITPGLARAAAPTLPASGRRDRRARRRPSTQSLVAKLTPNWAAVSLATQPPARPCSSTAPTSASRLLRRRSPRASGRSSALPGYNAWTTRSGQRRHRRCSCRREARAADGRVDIVSNPAEANVTIDGEFRGRSPLTVKLIAGQAHRAHARRSRATRPPTRSLSIAADSGRQLAIDLVGAIRRGAGREHAGRRGRLGRRRSGSGTTPVHALARRRVQPRHRDPARPASPSAQQRDHAAARLPAGARLRPHGARSEHGQRIRDRDCRPARSRAQADAVGPIHDGLVAARARPARERGAAAGAARRRRSTWEFARSPNAEFRAVQAAITSRASSAVKTLDEATSRSCA